MFNFKTRKKLKEQIASLEKQLEISKRDTEAERKKWLEERQYSSLLSNMNRELNEIEEQWKKENEELKATLERRNGVIKILEKDAEVLEEKLGKYIELEEENKELKEYKKLHEELEKFWEWQVTDVYNMIQREDRKLRRLRKERRRSQELHEEQIKKLKKEKVELKMDFKKIEETLKCTQDSWWDDSQRIESEKRLKEENKKLKKQNKKLNDVILKSKGKDRSWVSIAYVRE